MDYKDRQAGLTQEYFTNQAQLDLIRMLLKKTALPKSCRILSVGCGDGNELKILSRLGDVDIVDPDRNAIRLVPKDCFHKSCAASILDFKPKEKYDLVVAFDVLEHIHDDGNAAAQIAACLKDGGYFLLTVPAFQSLYSAHDKAMSHCRRYSPGGLRAVLEKDFEVRFMSFRYFFIFPPVLINKLLNRNAKPHVEAPRLPKPVNDFMLALMRLEIGLMGKGIRLPIGISLVAVCRKK